MEVAVYKYQRIRKRDARCPLPDAVFGVEPSDHAIYQDVRQTQANRPSGYAQGKGARRSKRYSKKKPYRQKGTGNARPGPQAFAAVASWWPRIRSPSA
jgi:large subunit ribosomal protein L4